MNNHYLLLSINRENSDEPKKSDANHVKSLPAGVGPLEGHFFGDANFVFLGMNTNNNQLHSEKMGNPMVSSGMGPGPGWSSAALETK